VANLTPVELLLRRDRLIVGGALAVAVGICWAWLVPAAHEMNLMLCDPTSWMMAASWDPRHVGTLFAMWAVMMAGMMLPAAAPTLMLYGCVVRKSPDGHRTAAQVNAFAGGYLLVWTVFSLGATLLQRVLTDFLLLSAMMEADSRILSAVLLLTAGVYQLTPLKRTCLSTCRFPALYLTRHWRRGVAGGFWMGIGHGVYCLGCCWALMLLLFVGGVMNLWWIAGLTLFVLLEKLAPRGAQGGRLSGGLLVVLGGWVLWQAPG
jgi:predicted metal-binding membrane protein